MQPVASDPGPAASLGRGAARRQSRRDRGMTALIEGFFGFVWFGWGQANASAPTGRCDLDRGDRGHRQQPMARR
jgi:hypothetical protein